jgi:cyclopropane fatty-acyl-phospholipid synthase-like methyltransferase
MASKSLTDDEYWNKIWSKKNTITYDSLDSQLRELLTIFDDYFLRTSNAQKYFIEIGCAFSKFLEIFRIRYGFNVSGIDYSHVGCEKTISYFESIGLSLGDGKILCRDILDESQDLYEKFDCLASFGLIEHFTEPTEILKTFGSFLKEKGILITCIPNTSSHIFKLQKLIDKDIYNNHMIMDKEHLESVHTMAGLCVLQCKYIGSLHFGVLNVTKESNLSRLILFLVRIPQAFFLRFLRKFRLYINSRLFSHSIICIAIKT